MRVGVVLMHGSGCVRDYLAFQLCWFMLIPRLPVGDGDGVATEVPALQPCVQVQ